ncbi:MAG: DUF1007 family protein [Rhodobacteraceae bacterium]|jgi:polyphosphate kinase|nr:DUF1007 family protein [Paracoccaceae bacterium]
MRGARTVAVAVVAGALALGPGAEGARAHPHVFIDAGVEFLFDDAGALAAVRIVWAYDEFFSLLVIEDMGLDPDFDGQLTAGEVASLSGFDMEWIEGYEGDLYLFQDGRPVALSGPLDWGAEYRDGRIVTSHVRALVERLAPAAAPLSVQVYDPTYYSAYRIAGAPLLTGRGGCTTEVLVPDLGAATARLEAALAEMTAADPDALEMDFPAVGAAFAEEIVLTCAPSS